MSRQRKVLVTSVLAAASLVAACTGTTGQQVRADRVTTTSTTSTTDPVPDCAETLPASAKAGQLLMVMVTTPDLAKEALKNGTVGGFGLKGVQPKDIGEKVAAVVKDAPITPFVGSDEEGGTVQRLANAIKILPSAAEMASGGKSSKASDTKTDGSPEAAAKMMGEYAVEMKKLGFNMMFGPVADVGSGSGLGTRSFSDEPTVVASFVTAIVRAVQDAGVIAVVKHWPGIGGGKSDPHDKLSALEPIDQLRLKDILPFQEAFKAGAKGVMVAHSVVPDLTQPNEPASISTAAITKELRGTEGFKGLVITDSLGMGAIIATTPQDEAAEKAIAAGADIALVSGADSIPKVHQRLTNAIASGRIPAKQVDESVRRVLAEKNVKGPCPDLVANMTRLEADAGTGATSSSNSDSPGTSASSGGTTSKEISTTTAGSKTTSTSTPKGRDTGINDTSAD